MMTLRFDGIFFTVTFLRHVLPVNLSFPIFIQQTLHGTMCEDTVFWDLNYAIKYRALGTEEIRSRVLKIMEKLDEKLFEHPNFVWLDHAAVVEILRRRLPNR